MSFYSLLFGRNSRAAVILGILGLTEGDFGRFRDVWVANGMIHVYTRVGGGNRRDYKDCIRALRKHPQYDFDEDDDFDETYCTFTFTFPPASAAELAALNDNSALTGDQRWDGFLQGLRAALDRREENKHGE